MNIIICCAIILMILACLCMFVCGYKVGSHLEQEEQLNKLKKFINELEERSKE